MEDKIISHYCSNGVQNNRGYRHLPCLCVSLDNVAVTGRSGLFSDSKDVDYLDHVKSTSSRTIVDMYVGVPLVIYICSINNLTLTISLAGFSV